MSNLVAFAESELRRAGLFDDGSDYAGALGPAAVEIIKVFAEQGHSGFSAGMITNICQRLMRFEPLTPLTGEDDEWNQVGNATWQNKRCSHVFKGDDGRAYDSTAVVFREPSGACFTSGDSRRFIEFPYTPKTEYVDVPGEEP